MCFQVSNIVFAFSHFTFEHECPFDQVIVRLHPFFKLLQPVTGQPGTGYHAKPGTDQRTSQRKEGHDYRIGHRQITSHAEGSVSGPQTVLSVVHR